MEIWVKLFISNDRQVLVKKSSDEDNGNPKLSIVIRLEDCEVDIGPVFNGGSAEDNLDKYFNIISQGDIDKMTQNFVGINCAADAIERM